MTNNNKKYGCVKFVDSKSGDWGFILSSDGDDYFFHRSGCLCDINELDSRIEVYFNIQQGTQGMEAVDIELVR